MFTCCCLFFLFNRSPHDSCLYLVTDVDEQAIFKSYDELQLFDKHSDHSVSNDVFMVISNVFYQLIKLLIPSLNFPHRLKSHMFLWVFSSKMFSEALDLFGTCFL